MSSSAKKAQNNLANAQADSAQANSRITNLLAGNLEGMNDKVKALQELSLDSQTKDLASSQWDTKRKLGETLLSQMPQYQQIGFNNQNVKDINKMLDASTDLNARKMWSGNNSDSAARGDWGSSYRAGRESSLGTQLAEMYNKNKTDALNLGTSIYGNNLANALSLMGFYGDTNYAVNTPSYSMPSMGTSAITGNSGSSINSAIPALVSAGVSGVNSYLNKNNNSNYLSGYGSSSGLA